MPQAPAKKPKKKKPAPPKRRGWRALFGRPSFFGNLVTAILFFLI